MKCFLRYFLLLPLLLGLTATIAQTYAPANNFGGKKEFHRLFKQEFIFPPTPLKEGISGKVLLNFQVKMDGAVEEIEISSPLHPDLDAECIRILEMMLWEPANYYGVIKDEKVELEFKIQAKQYPKLCKRRGYAQLPNYFEPHDSSKRVFDEKDCDKAAEPKDYNTPFALEKYLRENLKYPSAALTQSISGTSVIGFVVEPNGLLSNIHVVKDLGGGCSEETQRLLLGMNWKPAMKNGQYVRSQKEFKVIYKLPNNSKSDYVPMDNNVR